MMRLTEQRDAEVLATFCGSSLFGSYIMSRYTAYANEFSFAKCYIDRKDSIVVTALSVLEGSAVLLTSDRTDFEELSLALPLLSVQTLMTDSNNASCLPFPVIQEKQAFRYMGSKSALEASSDAPLRDVYDLISASIPGNFSADEEAYLHFLSDFTFRRNRGLARMKTVVRNERVCACALTAAECASSAVISGVACAQDCRGRGYGKSVVTALAYELQNEKKQVHVVALNDAAGAFYRRIGFVPAEKIVWLKIQ